MDIEIIGNHESARELIELTKQWDHHLEQCDAHVLTQGYADNVEVFDIGTQLVGRDKFKELWQSCFPFFGSSPKAVRRKLKIYASQDLAFLHCYSKICGSNQPTPSKNPWCRTTVCFQKTAGEWFVVHEHISMPIDFEKGSPALIFGEP